MEIEQFTDADRRDAELTASRIKDLAEGVLKTEQDLATSRTKLGALAHKVRSKKYWIYYGFGSFGEYIQNLEDEHKIKRAQLYAHIGVAEKLLPLLGESTLEEIGIGKATELKKLVASGHAISDDMLGKAKNPDISVDQVRSEVSMQLSGEPLQKGVWWDYGGFYISPEEKQELEETIDLAHKVDPVIPHDLPEVARRKQVMMRLMQEFRGTYTHEVMG